MANTIITKNSSTASAVPTSGDLVKGELAVNVTDKRLFTEDNGGTVVELGTNPSTMAVAGNATVGGTLGVTGLATLASSTLTANPTLSAGTANGVAYLNGSKVLTTGSALTFDGSNLTTVQSDGYNGLRVTNTSGKIRMSGYVNGTLGAYIDALNAAESAYTTLTLNGNPLVYQINGSEQMRLTSTGLGIGTSSPAVKLHVNAGAAGVQALFSYGTGTPTIAIGNSTTTYNTQIGYNVNSEYGYIQAVAAAGVYDDIAINPNGGNVGIGTSSPAYKLDVNGAIRASGDGSSVGLYLTTSAIRQNTTGGLYIDANASGAAGGIYFRDSSSFTTRLTIDSSGNLGLGVTPSAWSASAKALQITNYGAALSSFGGGATWSSLTHNAWFDGTDWKYTASSVGAALYQTTGSNAGSTHSWSVAAGGTAGNTISFTQAMTLDASGRLGIGTTSPSQLLHVSGNSPRIYLSDVSTGSPIIDIGSGGGSFYIGSDNSTGSAFSTSAYARLLWGVGAYPMVFATNNTERARIDSSGNLLVGTTSQINTTKTSIKGTSGTNVLGLQNSNDNNYLITALNSSGTEVFRVAGTGNVVNTNNSYGALSDGKLKENIVDASPKLADLMQVKVRNYNLIGDTAKQLGVIAQELETVFPAMVEEAPDRDAEGNDLGTTTKSVKYSVFVPMLIKAMQEQQAIINDLKARLDAANL